MGEEINRKLASVQVIKETCPIEGADRIEIVKVLGWQCVSQKGNYKPGDKAVYFEIDSWLPHEVAPFLTKEGHEPKVFEGVKGEKLRTIKLKGQLSQGLLLPVNEILPKRDAPYEEGEDVTEILGIKKWEKPIPAQLAGKIKGNFPSFLKKTDQERIQSFYDDAQRNWADLTFEVSIKLDGSSCSAYLKDGVFGVCSRNLDLLETEENSFWKTIRFQNIGMILEKIGRNLALQGELVGMGIQDNNEKMKNVGFRVFDIFDIDQQRYFLPKERREFCEAYGILHVPVIEAEKKISDFKSLDEALVYAEGFSLNPLVQREGVVFKSNTVWTDHVPSFKIISNKYLLGQKE